MIHRYEFVCMEAHLRAGIAIYNAGYYHAAHDAWEEYWLDLPAGDDRDFLQGLIQFTAAVYHVQNENAEGARGLAESAREYLDGLGTEFRGVELDGARTYLGAVESSPLSAGNPAALTHEGKKLGLTDLGFGGTVVAAEVLAEELGYDQETVEQGIAYARTDLGDGEESSQFVTLIFDFVRDDDHRAMVARRLGEHVERRAQRESDVDGLFGGQ
jgi:hypothetical protein